MLEVIGIKIKSNELDTGKVIDQLQDFSNKNELTIQLFDADFIYGKDHLISASEHAQRAFEQNTAISDSLSMEILLYASGEYQIKNALSKLGIKKDTKNMALAIMGEMKNPEAVFEDFLTQLKYIGLELERDDEVLIGDRNTLEAFGISKEELTAVPEDRWLELVLEKVALLDIQK